MLFIFNKRVKLEFKWHCLPIVHQKSWFDHIKNFSSFLDRSLPIFCFIRLAILPDMREPNEC
jgi:hypothetical protein